MSKQSLKEKLRKKRTELSSGGGKGNVLYIKEGTTRVRVLPIQQEMLAAEVVHFYFNEKLKGLYSASTLKEPCPVVEAYTELKNSRDESDQDIAKRISPKKAYLIPVVVYSDDKGKSIDAENSGKLMKISNNVYQAIIDLYLDDDEWGDMTDPKEGYDIKITRTGKGKNDTEYTVAPCKNTPLDKAWAKKSVDLDAMVKELIEPYDSAKAKLEEFLGVDLDEDDDDDKPKKKKKKASTDDMSSAKKKFKKGLKKPIKKKK